MKENETQYIRDENGTILYALVEYEDYKNSLRDSERLKETEKILKSFSNADDLPELIDAQIVHRLADGENPIRVWREHRGLKAIELASAAGISAAYLSELETGKKDGTFKTMTAIASILDIQLDDLAPPQSEKERETYIQRNRIKSIKGLLQELNHTIHTQNSFDTAAVRSMAIKVKSQIELLDLENLEEDWLMDAYNNAQNILHLIDEAESNIIHTATITREKLANLFDGYSTKKTSGSENSAPSVEEIFSRKKSSTGA